MKTTKLILTFMLLTFSLGLYAQEKDPALVEPDLPARGGAIAIPDNGYDGSLGSMACVTINETASGTVDDVDVEVTMEHTWIGDLTIKLVSPASTVATVLSRPGADESADDGGTAPTAGADANLVLANSITFSSTNGVVDAESMGDTIGDDEIVCADDGECSFIPNPDSAVDSGDLSTIFDGETAAGDWELCVGDSQFLDTGNLDSATLNVITGGGGTPAVSLDTTDFDFGIVQVNDLETTFIVLENTGTATLNVTAISDPGAPFGLALPGPVRGVSTVCSAPPFSLGPDQSCGISVNFTPTAPGDYLSSFDITSNAPSSPDTVTVRGTAPEPLPEAQVVPTMTWAGLIALMLILGGLGLVLMRRRQQA